MKKIALVLFGEIINNSGGAIKVLCEMANALTERGYKCTIICCDGRKGNLFFPLSEKVEIIDLACGSNDSFIFRSLKKVKREILRFFKILDKEKMSIELRYGGIIKKKFYNTLLKINPDVVITYDTAPVVLLNEYKNLNIPVISMVHTKAKFVFNNNTSQTLLKAYNNVDIIQVLNHDDENEINKYLKVPVIYIPNAVKSIDYTKDYDNCNNIITTIGRINEGSKQQHVLIEAFNILKKEFPEWTLEIWGGTASSAQENYKKMMIEYIHKNNLEEQVKFMGETKEVYYNLKRSDIFVLPSKKEGMPLTLMEAMSVGVPAIGYKSCLENTNLIVNNKNGFLVEDGIEDLANKLRVLMKNKNLRKDFGINGKKSIEKFSPDRVWDEWENIIIKLISKNNK